MKATNSHHFEINTATAAILYTSSQLETNEERKGKNATNVGRTSAAECTHAGRDVSRGYRIRKNEEFKTGRQRNSDGTEPLCVSKTVIGCRSALSNG